MGPLAATCPARIYVCALPHLIFRNERGFAAVAVVSASSQFILPAISENLTFR